MNFSGNIYHVYDQPNLPAVNAFHYLRVWVDYYEKHHKHAQLQPDDYIFPQITSNGTIQPHFSMSHDYVQRLLDVFVERSEISGLVIGKLTTHCFRRGGAQHRFIYVGISDRWKLALIQWWGGWANGEHVR
jgi:hypothetical protein